MFITKKLFTEHLEDVNESYLTHMSNSLYISIKLAIASSFALIHAFIPGFFTKSASNICREIVKLVDQRKSLSDL